MSSIQVIFMKDLASIILAGCQGTRMKADSPKVLFELAGKTLIEYCVSTVQELGITKVIVVVGYKRDLVKKALDGQVEYAVQEEQLGTGHAAQQAEALLAGFDGYVIVSYGDMPLLTQEMFLSLYNTCKQEQASAALLTVEADNFLDWGRVVRRENSQVKEVIEVKDASPAVAKIKEKNVGLYCFKVPDLFTTLKEVKDGNTQGEYYLTDVIGIMGRKGLKVVSVKTNDYDSIVGINSREDLAKARKILKSRHGSN